MLSNLKKSMFERGVTGKSIAAAIGVRSETVSDKLHEKTQLTRNEMFTIWRLFFSDIAMSELFASDNDKKEEKT